MNRLQRIIAALIALVYFTAWTTVQAEIEPNGTPDQANTLLPNGSDNGELNISTNIEDWWKITISSEGALVIATLSVSTLEIDNYLYDQDKKTQLASYLHGGSQPEDTVVYTHLLPGTYYVKSSCWSGQGSYTISSKFIATKYQNDAEPNDSAAVVTTFPI
jgi:hypothetical protein